MKMIDVKPINRAIPLIATMLISNFAMANSAQYPDSANLNISLPLNIQHNVNGNKVGGNPLKQTIYGDWSAWETSSYMTNCSAWSPNTDTVNFGELMIQTQICDAEETRYRSVTKIYENGDKETKKEYEYTYTKVDDEQEAYGTKNYIVSIDTVYSSWAKKGSIYSCSSWSPLTSTVETGKKYTQTKTCKQDETRTKTLIENWADGTKTTRSETTEARTTNKTDSRGAIGTKPISYRASGYCPSGWSFSVYSYRCYRNDAYFPDTPGQCPSGWELTPNSRCAVYSPASFSCDKGGVLQGTTCYIY